MTRRVISLILVLFFLLSGVVSTGASAAENPISPSGTVKQTNTMSVTSGELYDAVFYVDSVNNVQGIQADIFVVTSYFSLVSPYYVPNPELTDASCNINYIDPTYKSVPGAKGYRFNMLFDAKTGKSFSKKTELIRFKLRASTTSANAFVKYEVGEFFDSTVNMNDLDKSKITCVLEPAKSSATLSSIAITSQPLKPHIMLVIHSTLPVSRLPQHTAIILQKM